MTPFTVVLSLCIGVLPCGCPHSSKVYQIGIAYLALMKRAQSSASAALDMTALMMVVTFSIAGLLVCVSLQCLVTIKFPQAQLCVLSSPR